MALNNYQTVAQYEAATPSTTESTISHVEETNEVHINGVNVVTDQPKVGDIIFLDADGNEKIVAGETVNKDLLDATWTHVGYVFHREGNKYWVIDKNAEDEKYCDVLQFTISTITDTSITITLKDKTGTDHTIPITLTAAAIGGSSAAEIDEAIRAAAIDDQDWHAYLSTNGTGIIIQCDTWSDYRQYQCSMTGGTIAFTTWGDMPAADKYWKNDGGYTNYWGVMNVARATTYLTSNGRTPTAQEPIKVTGNVVPVTPDAFANSEYCADIRSEYGTYAEYLRNGYGVMYPQNLGTFAITEEEMSEYYTETTTTIGGETKYKFPAMANAYLVGYGTGDYAAGNWHLPTSLEGCYLMDDDTIAALAVAIGKMGTTTITNSTSRWFLERSGVYVARLFYGYYGYLYNGNVISRLRRQAVSLRVI